MTYEVIQLAIPNRENLKLATEIFKPDGKGPFPVVFLFHGFKGYKEDVGLVDIGKRLAKQGLVTVRFTSSGFGDSEGLIEDYRFSHYRADAQCVFDAINVFSYIDPSLVGVYGNSMGGKLAVLFCHDNPSVKVMCIASAPVTFRGTEYEALLPEWRAKGYLEVVSSRDKRTVRIPYDYVADVDSSAHDVLAAARLLYNTKTLVLVGDKDTEVPMKETKKIYDALSCPKEYIVINGMPHKYGREPNFIPVVNNTIADFFVKNL